MGNEIDIWIPPQTHNQYGEEEWRAPSQSESRISIPSRSQRTKTTVTLEDVYLVSP